MPNKTFGDQQDPEEPVWIYKGYRLKSSEFVTAMAHEFRAEIQHANVRRTRIDATANWAVLVSGLTISIALNQPTSHNGIILLSALLITLFLFTEARRFRYYELWSYRVRLMETDFFAATLVSQYHPSPDRAEAMSENTLAFNFTITLWEAIGLRLRRIYLWIFIALGIAWLAKYSLFPATVTNFEEFLSRAAIGFIPGPIVVSLTLAYFGFLALIAIFALSASRATGEAFHHLGMDHKPKFRTHGTRPHDEAKRTHTWPKQHELLVLIITNRVDAISKRILSESGGGTTSVLGKGNTMLVCVVTAARSKTLKAFVTKEDPQALVTILPAQKVWGRGFTPLTEE